MMRARLHQAVPVPQQLPQIAIFPARYPDLGKAASATTKINVDNSVLTSVRRSFAKNQGQ